jgi:amino acid transporter
VDWKRAAALLYGDWGTSKAYVTGIAFSLALYSSFWFVLAVSLLAVLIGINYIWICKYSPEGGGVYSSAKALSKQLALVGAFLLLADYVVTASLSCYDAFLYLNFNYEDAKRWAILMIFIIGCINFFGPRHTGSLAAVLGLATFVVVIILAVFSLPHLPLAIANLKWPSQEIAPHGGPVHVWPTFVGVVLALSGVEAVANTTGLMKLDPGSTPSSPKVAITSRKAILVVMIEIAIFTTLFGLAMHAIPDMDRDKYAGNMLRHLAEVFVDAPLSSIPFLSWLGDKHVFAWVVSFVFGALLLSAVNTALVDMVSVQYLMAKDGEMPKPFTMLNRFGVPWIVLLIAIIVPILVIDVQGTEKALHGLADLYAIGVVGAITLNLGSCAFNKKLHMRRHERIVMMLSCALMAGIEVTIAINKPAALLFAISVTLVGFTAWALHKGIRFRVPEAMQRMTKRVFPAAFEAVPAASGDEIAAMTMRQLGSERPVTTVMVSAKGVTPTLRYAVDQARAHNAQLIVLFIRELFTRIPVEMRAEDDLEAQALFQAVKSIAEGIDVVTVYAVSDDPAWTILDNTAIAGADMLILGHSRRTALTRLLRGNVLEQVASLLPEEIRLVIVG